MKDLFKDYLFTKHILVSDTEPDETECFNTIVALGNLVGINITKGMKYASKELVKFAADEIGVYVPTPFYSGFPESVRELSEDALLFDQIFHYVQTYGLGQFEETGHSVMESEFTRMAFKEDTTPRDFVILTEEEAKEKLKEYVTDLLESSRPLNNTSYEIVLEFLRSYIYAIEKIPCKQTAVRLLYDTRDVRRFAYHLRLADVVKLVDHINYTVYGNENLKKLNFRNKDRKFISDVIDRLLEDVKDAEDSYECFEKRKIWCGLLHHIHYQPKDDRAKWFVGAIRNGENYSVYSRVEKKINYDPPYAAKILYEEKGSSAVMRNLNYLLSRCKTEEDVKGVLLWVK